MHRWGCAGASCAVASLWAFAWACSWAFPLGRSRSPSRSCKPPSGPFVRVAGRLPFLTQSVARARTVCDAFGASARAAPSPPHMLAEAAALPCQSEVLRRAVGDSFAIKKALTPWRHQGSSSSAPIKALRLNLQGLRERRRLLHEALRVLPEFLPERMGRA